MNIMNFITESPFIFTILYIMLGTLTYWAICFFKIIENPGVKSDIIIIILWPLSIAASICIVIGKLTVIIVQPSLFILNRIFTIIITPILEIGKRLKNR